MTDQKSPPPALENISHGRWRRIALNAGVLALYSALAVLLFIDAWRSPTTMYIGGGGDPQGSMWGLGWTPFALSHHLSPWLTDYLNYPAGVNTMWETPIPFAGLVLWPVTATLGLVVSYNIVLTASVALSAWCAYLAIRRFVPHTLSAFCGGLLYGFSPYIIAQSLGHPNLTLAFIPPLLLIVLHEAFVRQRWHWLRTGLSLGGLLACQFYMSEELFATEVVVGCVGLALLMLLYRTRIRAALPYALRCCGTGAILLVSLTLWPLIVQFFGSGRPEGAAEGHDIFITDILNFFLPTSIQMIAPEPITSFTAHFSGNMSEFNGYLGIPLVAILFFTLFRFWKNHIIRFFGLFAIVIAILSLGPHLHVRGHRTPLPLPWFIADHVPIVNNILPNRLMLYVYLMAGVFLAFFVYTCFVRNHSYRRWVAGVALLATFAVLLPGLPRPVSAIPATPPFFTSAVRDRIVEGSPVLLLPLPGNNTIEPMLWQAQSEYRFRMATGPFPGADTAHNVMPQLQQTLGVINATGIPPVLSPSYLNELAIEFEHTQIHTVVVGPSAHQSELIAFIDLLTHHKPTLTEGVYLWTW